MKCLECSKEIYGSKVDETISFEYRGETKHICPDCTSDADMVLLSAFKDCKTALQQAQKPVIASKVYPEYDAGSKTFAYYLHYAYPHGERILTGAISGNSEQDVMSQLSELRKAVYGVS